MNSNSETKKTNRLSTPWECLERMIGCDGIVEIGRYGFCLDHRLVDDDGLTARLSGGRVQYGRNFWDTLDDRERMFLVCHEVSHRLLKHPERSGDREHGLWNVGCDVAIDEWLKGNRFLKMPEICLDSKSIECQVRSSDAEFYYEWLKEKEDEKDQEQQQQQQDQQQHGEGDGEEEERQDEDEIGDDGEAGDSGDDDSDENADGGANESEGDQDEGSESDGQDGEPGMGERDEEGDGGGEDASEGSDGSDDCAGLPGDRPADGQGDDLNDGEGDGFEWHCDFEPEDESDPELLQLDDAAQRIFSGVYSSAGGIPGMLKRALIETKAPSHRVDWKRELKRFAGKVKRGGTHWTSPRRQRIHMGVFPGPKRQRKKPLVVVGIDTSGSMSSDQFDEIAACLESLLMIVDVRVVQWGSTIVDDVEMKRGDKLRLKAGGGTRVQPLLRLFSDVAKHERHSGLVVFSDMAIFDMPKTFEYGDRVLWLDISRTNNHRVPFGTIKSVGI